MRHETQSLRRDRLSWVSQNYLRDETLRAANARLVAAQTGIPLARAWGGGEVASADSLRFVVPVRTVHAGPNPKYFGIGRGVTYYNLVSDQFTGLHGITVPGTLRDSLVLLAVALEQQTELQPTQIMTDTGAYSDVVFGLFRLLGYRFSPRLADIGGTRFWRLRTPLNGGRLGCAVESQPSMRRIPKAQVRQRLASRRGEPARRARRHRPRHLPPRRRRPLGRRHDVGQRRAALRHAAQGAATDL